MPTSSTRKMLDSASPTPFNPAGYMVLKTPEPSEKTNIAAYIMVIFLYPSTGFDNLCQSLLMVDILGFSLS